METDICDSGYTAIRFFYTPGVTHKILVIATLCISIILIIASVYVLIRKWKQTKTFGKIVNIIFMLLTIYFVYVITFNNYLMDLKYGNKIQVDENKLATENKCVMENCRRLNNG